MKVLVTGGTGMVGSELVKELRKRDVNVRILARNLDASKPAQVGVEFVRGDLLDPVSVEKALDGADKLYLLNAVAADELTQCLIAYDLAKRMKLKQVVYYSVFKAESFKDVPHFASKLTIENALREFDLPFTISSGTNAHYSVDHSSSFADHSLTVVIRHRREASGNGRRPTAPHVFPASSPRRRRIGNVCLRRHGL